MEEEEDEDSQDGSIFLNVSQGNVFLFWLISVDIFSGYFLVSLPPRCAAIYLILLPGLLPTETVKFFTIGIIPYSLASSGSLSLGIAALRVVLLR